MKRIKKGVPAAEKNAPPPVALRRYDELVELQQQQQQQQRPNKNNNKRPSTSATISLEAAIAASAKEVTLALEDAGILEHRAILTGKTEDADAYSAMLVRLDGACAELWAREALGRHLRIQEVDEERIRVVDEAREAASKIPAQQPRSLESRMDFRRRLISLVPLPEAAVEIVGIREVGPGARDLATGSDAAMALRKRLSQVAKVADGPMTVKVLLSKARRNNAKGKK